jgi:uncharacterized membrane protein
MQKKSGQWILAISISASSLFFLAALWNKIPAIVPIHYNFHMAPDRMGDKIFLLYGVIFFAIMGILVFLLMTNLHRIDPKRADQTNTAGFVRFSFVIIALFAALNWFMISYTINPTGFSRKIFFPVLSLFLAFLGNYMQNLKPNYFAGIRLPWTLASDQNWRKTHRLSGKLWFSLGLASAIITCFLDPHIAAIYFGCILLIMIIVPICYSYQIFRMEKSKS